MRKDFTKRIEKLRKFEKMKERVLKRVPDGYLRVATTRGKARYYAVSPDGNRTGSYLGKGQIKLARQLAQKDYDQKVLKAAQQELKAIEAYENKLPKWSMEEIYEHLSPARQELVTPIEPADEEFIKEWTSVEWDRDWFGGDKPSYPTTNGELTRSRIEALIADMLHRNGWYYRYEYPVKLKENGVVRTYHPDFTILDVKNRREILLEHFGVLHDSKYQKQMIEKMETYRDNGYQEGVNIIYTFECEGKNLDLRKLERYLHQLLD